MRLKYIFPVLIILLIIHSYYYYLRKTPNHTINEYLLKTSIEREKKEIVCHFIESKSLPNIQDIDIKIDQSIFFIETSCNSYEHKTIFIKPRQACAVESAAILNPNRQIYLLYASPGEIDIDSTSNSSRLLRNLLSYPNIQILRIHVADFVMNSPVEKLWRKKTIFDSIFPLAHISDILRLLVLWKYGGIYLDLDVIVIKSLEKLPLNFAGAESTISLNGAVLSFSHRGRGHQYVEYALNRITGQFNGTKWAANGPDLITEVIQHFCDAESEPLTEIINKTCGDFHIYSTDAFYPVPWQQWKQFLNENKIKFITDVIRNSYIVHFWNKFSSKIQINANVQDVPYIELAANFCTGTLMNVDKIF